MYKLGIIALCLVLVGLQYRLWIADGGYPEVVRLTRQTHKLADGNEKMKLRNDAQAAEIADLKSGSAAMEGRARSKLGMIRDDEKFYLVISPKK